MFVRLWMTPDPTTIKAENSVGEAIALLAEKKLRRLPVVNSEGELVGIISRQDLTAAMPSILDGSSAGSPGFLADTTRVEEVMTARPMWVEPLSPLEEVALKMRRYKIGGMPVVEGARLVGIITESDIFRAFAEVLGAEGESVRLELLIGKRASDLYDVLDIFKRYNIFIQAMTIHHNFGENQRLLTVRLTDGEIVPMLDALGGTGTTVNRVLGLDEL